jgi:hypothetical protein
MKGGFYEGNKVGSRWLMFCNTNAGSKNCRQTVCENASLNGTLKQELSLFGY